MKKLLFTLLVSITSLAYSQAPQQISYQGVARNASGTVLANQPIGIKFDIHQGSASGAIVYTETHTGVNTNSFGLFTTYIGSISNLGVVNWASGPYFIEVSIDPNTGTYSSLGSQQLMSVPYALNAGSAPAPAVSFTNNILSVGGNTTTIPAGTTYTAGTGINVTGNTITNTAPDQTVTITPAGSATVSGSYPNFTITTPTAQVYSAGNGIDITGGVISNTAAAVTPTITGTGATTVNGTYPTLTINTPTTPVYTAGNGIDINGTGVITGTANIIGTGATTVSGTYPNLTINTPTTQVYIAGNGIDINAAGVISNTLTPITPTITSSGIALVTPTTGNNFNVSVPQPTLSYNTTGSVLSLTHDGTTTTTVALTGTGSSTINMTGAGIASVSPTSGSAFTVTVPNPTFTTNGPTSISGSYPNYTVNSVTSPSTSLVAGNTNIQLIPGTNSYTLNAYTYSLSNTSNTLTLTNGAPFGYTSTVVVPTQSLSVGGGSISISGGNSVAIPTSSTTLVQGNNISLNQSGSTYTVNAPAYSLSSNSNTLTLTNGTVVSTVTVPASSNYFGTPGNISITSNSVNLVPTGVTSGTYGGVPYAVPSFSVDANGRLVNASSFTPSIGGDVTGSIAGSTVSAIYGRPIANNFPSTNQVLTWNGSVWTPMNTASTATITGTGVATVNNVSPNYTVNVPMSTYNNNTGVFTTGTQTIAVTPTLTLVGNVLRSGPATNTVNIPVALLSYTGSATQGILQSGAATNTVSIPNYTLSNTSNTITLNNGTANSTAIIPVPTLTLTGNILQSGPVTNTVNLSSIPGLWTAPTATSIVTTNSTSLVGIGTTTPGHKLDVVYSSTATAAVHGVNSGAGVASTGVFGEHSSNGIGVYGQSSSGQGIFGKSTSSTGVYGESVTGDAGKFILPNAVSTGNAISAQTNGTGAALYAKSFNSVPIAALFDGHVFVGGKLKVDSSLTMAAYNVPPNTSFINEGRIYYDRPANKFKVSENGGAYVDLIPGASSAPWIQGASIVVLSNMADKVGIGTNTPSESLDVNGNINIANTTASSGIFKMGGINFLHSPSSSNLFLGLAAGNTSISGFNNIGMGQVTLQSITTGANNVGLGFQVMQVLTTGSQNIAIGTNALSSVTTGNNNTALGFQAGNVLTTGTNNLFLGYNTNASLATLTNASAIGSLARVDASNSMVLGSITGINGATANTKVGIGTTTPLAALDVASTGNINAISASASGTVDALSAKNSNAGVNAYAGNFDGGIISKGKTSSSTGFALRAINSSTLELFNVRNDGNVGINVTNPGYRLAVSENTNTLSAIYAFNSSTVSSSSAHGISGLTSNTHSLAAGLYGNNTSAGPSIYAEKSATQTGIAGRFEILNTGNTGDGIFVSTNGGGVAIHAVNGPTVAGSSNVAMWLESGHIKATQTTAAVVTTVTATGGLSATGVALTVGTCNDVKGSLSAVCTTTGMINPGGQITFRITFNKAYTVNPTVVVTPNGDPGQMSLYISTINTGFVNVTFKNNTTTNLSGGSFTFGFNYMVIE